MEIFKSIEEFPGYQVGDKGTVLGKKGKPLTQNFCAGYLHTGMRKGGKQIFRNVHRLVAIAFLPNPAELPQVNHKDEERSNNEVGNLEWCTSRYNQEYSLAKEVGQFDTETEEMLGWWDSVALASEATQINKGNIANCCRGIYGYKTAGGFIWRYL